LCPRLRGAGQSTAVAGLPLDRMPALHPPRGRGRGPPRRTLGGNEQNRMRTPHMSIDNIDNPRTDDPNIDHAHIDERSRTGLSTLDVLESEAIHIIREVAAEFERPVLLFSGGKDSVTVLHLAAKAFWPAKIPFGLLHVDTGHNFPEIIRFRDETAQRFGLDLTVAKVQDYIDDGRLRERPDGTRNTLQTQPLIDAIAAGGFDAVFGGARRDEDKARAKERILSLRDEFGGWNPSSQRPELWNIYNGRHLPGEHVRVFPISNFTELDVWSYIAREDIDLPELYFAHDREVFNLDGMWRATGEYANPREDDTVVRRLVRYRTVGDMSCTGAVESQAADIESILAEVAATTVTERGATRADDRISAAAMEDRKKDGYF